MENGLFRQKSIERISSPEELHDYMRVTSPRLWMILAAVVVLLAGFIVYASTTTMENTRNIKVTVSRYELTEEQMESIGLENGDGAYSVYAEMPIEQGEGVKTGMKLRLGSAEGHVSLVAAANNDQVVTVIFEIDRGIVPVNSGEYDAELVLESTTPISFLWN